ncbi:hypothetical protein [Nocardia thailandica]|uniref:hypothetical protein n=1 Tax=Nocardia thailandica TaxID=257275 RepID=UPI00030D099C|nr:hypothetical protein [Nocardia thailandica]
MTQSLTVPLRSRLRAAVTTLLAPATQPSGAETTPASLTAELAAAHRDGDAVTVRTRGGHSLAPAMVTAVQPRYTTLTTPDGEQVIVPLRFIETVQRHRLPSSASPEAGKGLE